MASVPSPVSDVGKRMSGMDTQEGVSASFTEPQKGDAPCVLYPVILTIVFYPCNGVYAVGSSYSSFNYPGALSP